MTIVQDYHQKLKHGFIGEWIYIIKYVMMYLYDYVGDMIFFLHLLNVYIKLKFRGFFAETPILVSFCVKCIAT